MPQQEFRQAYFLGVFWLGPATNVSKNWVFAIFVEFFRGESWVFYEILLSFFHAPWIFLCKSEIRWKCTFLPRISRQWIKKSLFHFSVPDWFSWKSRKSQFLANFFAWVLVKEWVFRKIWVYFSLSFFANAQKISLVQYHLL